MAFEALRCTVVCNVVIGMVLSLPDKEYHDVRPCELIDPHLAGRRTPASRCRSSEAACLLRVACIRLVLRVASDDWWTAVNRINTSRERARFLRPRTDESLGAAPSAKCTAT